MITLKPVSPYDEYFLRTYVDSYREQGELIEGNVGMITHMPFHLWYESLGNSDDERTHMILNGDTMVGSLDFRLNQESHSRLTLGDIGYSVHPLHRNQGYVTAALKLAIQAYPHDELIITCIQSNIPSVKAIEKNGGILRNTFMFDGQVSNRYVILKDNININNHK